MQTKTNKLGVIFSALIFASSWLGLYLYLLFYHNNWIIFWILVLSMIFSLFYQILFTHISRKLIYIEVIMLLFNIQLINLTYVETKVFILDTYKELTSTKHLLLTGHWNPSMYPLDTTPYPVIHILGATIHLISSLPLLDLTQIIGPFLYILLTIIYILLLKKKFKNDNAVLLASLALIFTFPYAMGANFGRQPIAILFFILFIYFIFNKNSLNNLSYALLSTILAIALIFAHHLTRVIVFIFLILYLFLWHIFKFKKFRIRENECSNENILINYYLMFFLIGIFAYFIYIGDPAVVPFIKRAILILLGEYFTLSNISLPIPVYRIIFLWGSFITIQIFIFIYIAYIYKYKENINFINIFNIVFTELIHPISKVSKTLLIPFTYYRALLFTSPFILMTWSQACFNPNIRKKYRAIFITLIFLYIILNIVGYFPYVYDKSLPTRYDQIEWRRYLSFQEINAVKFFDITVTGGRIYGDYYIYVARLYFNDKVNTILDPILFTKNYNKQKYIFWLIFRKDNKEVIFYQDMIKLFKVTDEIYLEYHIVLNVLYDNGYIEIFTNLDKAY